MHPPGTPRHGTLKGNEMLTSTLIVMAIAAIFALMVAVIDTTFERADARRDAEFAAHMAASRAFKMIDLPRRIAAEQRAHDIAKAGGLNIIAAYHADAVASLSRRLAIVEGR